MWKNPRLQAVVILAAGALLGYVAASGNFRLSRTADAAPSTGGEVAKAALAEAPSCCSEGLSKAQFVSTPAAQNALAKAALKGQEKNGKKPNVVVIFCDDMGWGDPGCFGGGETRGAPTPHIDRMAAEGARFTQWYGQASCTAGRASFMTGRIPIRSALSVVIGLGDPNKLHAVTPTIAEFYKKNGYSTYMSGKWHLGDVPDSYPIEHGFDEMKHMLCYYAGVYGYRDPELHPWFPNWDPKFIEMYDKIVNDGEYEGVAGQPAKQVKKHFGYKDLATIDNEQAASAQNYIKTHAKDEKPFFMYVAFMKLHQPNNPGRASHARATTPTRRWSWMRMSARSWIPSAKQESTRTPSSYSAATTARGSMRGPMPDTHRSVG
jgi:arylsulfatase A-like enzyme